MSRTALPPTVREFVARERVMLERFMCDWQAKSERDAGEFPWTLPHHKAWVEQYEAWRESQGE